MCRRCRKKKQAQRALPTYEPPTQSERGAMTTSAKSSFDAHCIWEVARRNVPQRIPSLMIATHKHGSDSAYSASHSMLNPQSGDLSKGETFKGPIVSVIIYCTKRTVDQVQVRTIFLADFAFFCQVLLPLLHACLLAVG